MPGRQPRKIRLNQVLIPDYFNYFRPINQVGSGYREPNPNHSEKWQKLSDDFKFKMLKGIVDKACIEPSESLLAEYMEKYSRKDLS